MDKATGSMTERSLVVGDHGYCRAQTGYWVHSELLSNGMWPMSVQRDDLLNEIERLRAALEEIANCPEWDPAGHDRDHAPRSIARRALDGSDGS